MSSRNMQPELESKTRYTIPSPLLSAVRPPLQVQPTSRIGNITATDVGAELIAPIPIRAIPEQPSCVHEQKKKGSSRSRIQAKKNWAIVPQGSGSVAGAGIVSKDVIFTSTSNHPEGIPGVCMRHCLMGTGMYEPNEELTWIARKGKYINFSIMWPGYEQALWFDQIMVRTDGRGMVTRAELAYHVATEFARFIKMWETFPITAESARWRIGFLGFGLQQMRLVRLVNTDSNTWMAEVIVVDAKPTSRVQVGQYTNPASW